MAANNLPVPPQSRTAAALARGKQAAQSALARIRSRERQMKNSAVGLGAGYFAAKWWGKRRAEADRGDIEQAGFSLGPLELDGTKIGAGLGIAGALGLFGDEMYDTAAYATGVAVLSADAALDGYAEKIAEPPKAA